MSIQDQAQHHIAQIDKEVRIDPADGYTQCTFAGVELS